MRGRLTTAGEIVDVECRLGWAWSMLVEAAAGGMALGGSSTGSVRPPTMRLVVEADRRPFDDRPGVPLTRGARMNGEAVVFDDACASGFSLRLEPRDSELLVTARYRPRPQVRAASSLLRSRFHFIARAVLLQYPAIWWAGVHGRAPLHVSALTTAAGVAVLAGPGGVGKSTMLADELAAGATATCDNLAVSDGSEVFGVAEPIRTVGGNGRRVDHGRREAVWGTTRATSLQADRVVVVRLRDVPRASCEPLAADAAVRSLTTGTFMAGELRRYWAFGATLAAGTGLGPAQPAVAATAERLAAALPCYLVTLARSESAQAVTRPTLSELFAPEFQGRRQ
jgi:hypothetical protein